MRYTGLILFLLISVGGGLLIGSLSMPDQWYVDLAKPSFNPPGWIFGPVWTALYILIGYAGARIWARELNLPIQFWFTQMILNFLWSPVFFSFHSTGTALLVIGVLLVTILGFIATTWRSDRVSALLFVPYAAWVGFATLLNFEIWRLNS